MDFLKQHYEKIALGLVLIVLIVTGVVLAIKVQDLNREIDESPRRPPMKGAAWETVNLLPYSNALQRLNAPAQWTNVPLPLFPPSVRVEETAPTSIVIVTPKTLPFRVERVYRETFELLFKSYSYDAEKDEGYNFQVNLQRNRTYFVRSVGELIGDTQVRILKFEHKTREYFDPTTNSKRLMDVSELTIQRPNGETLVLVLGQETLSKQPVAQINCPTERRPIRCGAGETFTCSDRTYKVVDIGETQVIILDTLTGEKHTVRMGAGGIGSESEEQGQPSSGPSVPGVPPGINPPVGEMEESLMP